MIENNEHPRNSQERREKRIPLESIVSVGAPEEGRGFDAEAVDLSGRGIRLRTAYLPALGQRLVCKLDSAEGELELSGEVVWRTQQARGGDFGLRFGALDPASQHLLKSMLAEPEVPGKPAKLGKGVRVRLHIEGLGAPMKARVREESGEEIVVGSSLEFLRVGRALELEDVEGGHKSSAYVDRVVVEVDPVTSIPQLVVALRHELPTEARPGTLSYEDAAEAHDVDGETLTPIPVRRLEDIAGSTLPSMPIESSAATDASRALAERSAVFAQHLAESAKTFSAAVGTWGRAAATQIKAQMTRVKERRAGAAADNADIPMPRRTTAPPPSGVLKAEGRKLIREENFEPQNVPPVLPSKFRPSKRLAGAVGGVVGIALVATLAITRTHAPDTAGSTLTDAAPTILEPTSPMEPPVAADPAAAVIAKVPLYGATPLSTVEVVPPPAPELAQAPLVAQDPLAAGNVPPLQDLAGAASAGAQKIDVADKPHNKTWARGAVKRPKVLRIKMDGEIEHIEGKTSARAMTIRIPERRSSTKAAGLSKRDSRIEAASLDNSEGGSEVVLTFRDRVPAFHVEAKGDELEIALGQDATVASKAPAKKVERVASASKKSAPKRGATKPKP